MWGNTEWMGWGKGADMRDEWWVILEADAGWSLNTEFRMKSIDFSADTWRKERQDRRGDERMERKRQGVTSALKYRNSNYLVIEEGKAEAKVVEKKHYKERPNGREKRKGHNRTNSHRIWELNGNLRGNLNGDCENRNMISRRIYFLTIWVREEEEKVESSRMRNLVRSETNSPFARWQDQNNRFG